MGAKSKQKKPKKKRKGGPKKAKRERLAKVRGTAPNPKERRTQLRG